MDRTVKWTSLAEASAALDKLDWSKAAIPGAWTIAQVLSHCAQSIECAVSGFPVHKPWLFRATIGKIALRKFIGQGYMSHDVEAPIPGLPPPDAADVPAALARLVAAIRAFEAAPTTAMHFAYGPVDKARYDQVQAMHIADHVARFTFA